MADNAKKTSTGAGASANAKKSRNQQPSTTLVGFILLAVFFLVGVVIWEQRPVAPGGMGHPAVGIALSNLDLQPLTGAKTRVTLDDLKGHVTLINYWGVWCPPCRQEFPHIVALSKEFESDSDFQLLSVSCPPSPQEESETLKEETEAFLKHERVELDTYADRRARSMIALVQDTESDGAVFPTTVLVGKNGEIEGFWQGYLPGYELQMHTAIKNLLVK